MTTSPSSFVSTTLAHPSLKKNQRIISVGHHHLYSTGRQRRKRKRRRSCRHGDDAAVTSTTTTTSLWASSSSSSSSSKTTTKDNENDNDNDDDVMNDDPYLLLWKLASAHCASQALSTIIQLNIPCFLLQKSKSQSGGATLEEIVQYIRDDDDDASSASSSNQSDALLRLLRLLTTVDILKEEQVEVEGEEAVQEVEEEEEETTCTEERRRKTTTTTIRFSLTSTGKLLVNDQQQQSMVDGESSLSSLSSSGIAAGIQHWMERPLWSSWLQVGDYLKKKKKDDDDDPTTPATPTTLTTPTPTPFELANDGISSDYYYNQKDHPNSLEIANTFVKWVHQQEVEAVVKGYDWKKSLALAETGGRKKKRLLDIGGHYGTVLAAIQQHVGDDDDDDDDDDDAPSSIEYISLDLPDVIASAPSPSPYPKVQLVSGDVMDPTTIPKNCDVILLKHFLDRCMWSHEETIQILQNCRLSSSFSNDNDNNNNPNPNPNLPRVIIAEAVLPDIGYTTTTTTNDNDNNNYRYHPTALYMDALYMLVGREGQRTEAEWRYIAKQGGFHIQEIITTCIPSCSLLVLEPICYHN